MLNEKRKEFTDLLVCICEDSKTYQKKLTSFGYRAFEVYQKFLYGFCFDCNEKQFHEKYTIETMKERIGQFNGVPILSGIGDGYRSPFLEEKRSKRDTRNGVPYRQLGTTNIPLYKGEIDRCEINRGKMMLNSFEKYEKLEQERFNKEEKFIHEEASQINESENTLQDFDKNIRYKILIDKLNDKLVKYGFVYDKKRSTKNIPIYSRGVNKNIEMCISISEDELFWKGYDNWCLDLVWYLRYISYRPARLYVDKSDKYIIINYKAIIPGINVYDFFNSEKELRLSVDVQIKLISILYNSICNLIDHVYGK
jgi:hypothetical protein